MYILKAKAISYSQRTLLIIWFVGDNNSITGVDTNVVYVCDMCKNSEHRDDQCEGLPTSIHRSLGFNFISEY